MTSERPFDESVTWITNDAGDIVACLRDGIRHEVDPETEFGWTAPGGKSRPENRSSAADIAALPYFSVSVEDDVALRPGHRPVRPPGYDNLVDGAAPPAAARSKGGNDGTFAYFDRLSDAFGHVVERLPGRPERSPFLVRDLLRGTCFVITYEPPPLQADGNGVVYVLDDGDGIKIGHTTLLVAQRIRGLQTGNPRLITALASVGPASVAVEEHLLDAFDECHRRGEWFHREPMLQLADEAGGWRELLESRLPKGDWVIDAF